MSMMYFDTLKFVEKLKAAGVSEAQAKAEAEVLADVLDGNIKDLATKFDMAAMKTELKAEISDLRKDMARMEERMEGKMIQLEQRMVIKLGALMVVAVGAVATLVKLL
jgi:hypothetical protein